MNSTATTFHPSVDDADFHPLDSKTVYGNWEGIAPARPQIVCTPPPQDHQIFYKDENGALRNEMVSENTARNWSKFGKKKLLVMKDGVMIVARGMAGMADFKPEGW